MKPIVQCVPNFSEGRDLDKVEAIVKPLKDQEGFTLVSYEPDKDYNRTVVTLLGDPEAMIKPLLAFMKRARDLIDMNKQSGEHPRMGAIDVVPFIPIQGIDMETCVKHAHTLGENVADTLDIPIFMYGEASVKKGRKRLPNIRKGEFEGMNDKIKEDQWHPDYGKPSIHPKAGATAIGARLPLIAYNIDLDTDDIEIAKKIARAIRGSSGGFKHVQAGPVYLEERKHVQVTMNILNYKQNPIYRINEVVALEAKRYGKKITGSEIVGLIPKDTIVRSIKYYAAIEDFDVSEDNMEKLSTLAKQYLHFRDFDLKKIIEANIE